MNVTVSIVLLVYVCMYVCYKTAAPSPIASVVFTSNNVTMAI